MLKSNVFRNTIKHCLECNSILKLNNCRDIERKKFCSRNCRATFNGKQCDMTKLWEKNNTPEVNAKKAHHGKNHPRWIEDRSLVKFRPRPEINNWRKFIFERDNYTCLNCKQKGGKLQAHHKFPYKTHPELRFSIENGMTLCEPCHKEIHAQATKIYGAIHGKQYKGEQIADFL